MAKSNFLTTIKTKGVLAPHLENYFSKGKFPDAIPVEINPNKEKDTAFHPSSDVIGCARMIFAKRKGLIKEGKPAASMQRIWQIGHMYHGWIQYIVCHELGFCDESAIEREFRATLDGKILDNSIPWAEDPLIAEAKGWMRGHSDIVPVHIPGRADPVLIDIKSIAGHQIGSVGQDNSTWEKYEAQARMYLDWNGLDTAVVLYIGKDTPHDFKERIVTRDDTFVEAVYEKWEGVAEAEAAGLVPRCTCDEPATCPAARYKLDEVA